MSHQGEYKGLQRAIQNSRYHQEGPESKPFLLSFHSILYQLAQFCLHCTNLFRLWGNNLRFNYLFVWELFSVNGILNSNCSTQRTTRQTVLRTERNVSKQMQVHSGNSFNVQGGYNASDLMQSEVFSRVHICSFLRSVLKIIKGR